MEGFPQDYYERVKLLCEQMTNPEVEPKVTEEAERELRILLSERAKTLGNTFSM